MHRFLRQREKLPFRSLQDVYKFSSTLIDPLHNHRAPPDGIIRSFLLLDGNARLLLSKTGPGEEANPTPPTLIA